MVYGPLPCRQARRRTPSETPELDPQHLPVGKSLGAGAWPSLLRASWEVGENGQSEAHASPGAQS